MAAKAGAPLLSFFWDLAAVDIDKRVKAAASLLDVLQTAQKSHEAGEPEAESPACADLVYAVRRLVRGIASSRDGARQGFGAALIEVLITFPSAVSVESVLTLMEESMQLQGSMKGPEERDMLFGRVFSCAAIVRSGRLGAMPSAAKSALAERLAKELLFCVERKAFLQELGSVILVEMLRQLTPTELQTSVWPMLAPMLEGAMDEWTPHALLIALELARLLPSGTLGALLPGSVSLQGGTLVNAANLPSLVAPLKAASCAHPQLHAVWGAVLETLTTPAATAAASGAASEADDAKKKKKEKKKAKAAKEANGVAEANGNGVAEANGNGNGNGAGESGTLRAFWQAVVEE